MSIYCAPVDWINSTCLYSSIVLTDCKVIFDISFPAVSLLLFTVKPPIYTVSLSSPAWNNGLSVFLPTVKAPVFIYSALI